MRQDASSTPRLRARYLIREGLGVVVLAAPILLGSWWALLPGGLAAGLFIVRTALEDRTLQRDLAG